MFGFHYENEMLAVNLFHLRAGKIVDRREFFWEDLPEFASAEPEVGEIPDDIEVMPHDILAAPPVKTPQFSPSAFFSALLKQAP